MSINMYVDEVRQQVQSVSKRCTETIQTMESIQKSLNSIIIEPRLKGTTYDSMKIYFNTVYMPVTRGFILVSEQMIASNKTFLDRYLSEVDVNSLQESVLEERIRKYDELSRTLDSFLDPIGLNQRMINGLQEMKKKTTQKLHSLQEYNYFSIQIFDELDRQLTALETGINVLAEGKAWNQSTGTFSTNGLNLDWATTINYSWKAYEDQKKGIDEEKIAELKEYKVYAMIYTGMDGEPYVSWQIEKNGKGVKNPELYQYLRKAGNYLDEDSFEFITQEAFNKKVEEGWINGYNYVTGEVYNPVLGGIVSVSQKVENGVNWLNESELGQALQILGFTYASYKLTTVKGSSPLNKKSNGTDPIKQTNDFATKPFLPDEYYKNNYSSMDGIPNSKMEFYRVGSSGNIEKSIVIYDKQGKQSMRIDYSDHGNSLHHTDPHIHEFDWFDGGKSANEIKYFVDDNGLFRKGVIDKNTNTIKFLD